jgi:hypothetical protein
VFVHADPVTATVARGSFTFHAFPFHPVALRAFPVGAFTFDPFALCFLALRSFLFGSFPFRSFPRGFKNRSELRGFNRRSCRHAGQNAG